MTDILEKTYCLAIGPKGGILRRKIDNIPVIFPKQPSKGEWGSISKKQREYWESKGYKFIDVKIMKVEGKNEINKQKNIATLAVGSN